MSKESLAGTLFKGCVITFAVFVFICGILGLILFVE